MNISSRASFEEFNLDFGGINAVYSSLLAERKGAQEEWQSGKSMKNGCNVHINGENLIKFTENANENKLRPFSTSKSHLSESRNENIDPDREKSFNFRANNKFIQ